ncbi:hypothetical protein NDU88_007319 [Pleurodeles waltl]|uniref:Uncharacterized protein n=1 Tax=Pleurodeles waltl TaxID=8319 RepID=A0AAV7UPS0_PLEWA|nr:hypothetical protein NDU88_007319 [Pleurodeles waltl]
MDATRDLKSLLEPKLDAVTLNVNLLPADFRKMSYKLKTEEKHLHLLQSTTKTFEDQVQSTTKQQAQMAAQLEDQEGRVRRNNIRVVGVPVGAGGPAVDLFLEDLITNHLWPKRLFIFFSIERAHRVWLPPLRPGALLRTIIARVFNHRDRDAILQTARSRGTSSMRHHCEVFDRLDAASSTSATEF